jgi:hypothetical protein
MNPRVRVTLTTDYGQQAERTIELSGSMYKDAAQKIDKPSADARGSDFLLCTDTATINKVLKSRRELADMVSAAITKAILDHLGAHDTEMGYTREQQKGMR